MGIKEAVEAAWPAAKRRKRLRSSHDEKTRALVRELPAKKRGEKSRGHRGINVTSSVVRHKSKCESSMLVVDIDVQVFKVGNDHKT